MAPARTIIVDIRTNPGGSDLIGLAYAGYFTATPVPVLSKTTRTSTGYSASLHHVLQPQGGPVLSQRVMLALWGMLAQFSYTKMVIVVDADIDARNWDDIAWALATRMDPARDVMVLDSTPMDYLDFASPRRG
jgi:3-polyprenyl-4-hydroxybenzoate decarboxylase